MPDEIKINRASVQPAMQPKIETPMPSGAAGMPAKKPSRMPWIILIVVVIILAAAAILFRGQLFGKKGAVKGASISASGYQAVFLTNGQVYFGKLSDTDKDYVTMTDIYYLQVVQPPLQGQQTATTTPQSSTISLVKLGNELHGPVDVMHISRSQVLFYEDLKEDGQVVKAILTDKAGGSQAK